MTNYEKIIISITGSSHLLVHSLMLTLPSLIPLVRDDFKVGIDTLGFVVSISALFFGLGAIPAGWMDRYFGKKRLLIIYQIGSSASAIFIAYSSNFFGFVFGLSLLGLFCSIYHPIGLTLISQRISNVSRGMAIHGMFGSMGSALGPLLAVLIAGLFTWRHSYLFLGLLNAILSVITFLLISNKSKILKKPNDINKNKTNISALIYYFITNSFLGMAYYGFTTFMPIHLSINTAEFLPLIPENIKAGLFPTLVFFAGMIGALIGGKIGNKFDKKLAFMAIIIINIPIFFIVGQTTNLSLILFSMILGIVYFSNQPIGNTLVSDFTDNSNRGFIYGLGFFISFGIGSFAAGLSGIIAVKFSVSAVFSFMGFLLVPSVGFAWMMYRASIK